MAFDGEGIGDGGAIDAGGPHCVALQLFASVFAERYFDHAIVSEHKARAQSTHSARTSYALSAECTI